jgi:hypothetical protein
LVNFYRESTEYLGAIRKLFPDLDFIPTIRAIVEGTNIDQEIETHPPTKVLRLREKFTPILSKDEVHGDGVGEDDNQVKPKWKVNYIQGMAVKNLPCEYSYIIHNNC